VARLRPGPPHNFLTNPAQARTAQLAFDPGRPSTPLLVSAGLPTDADNFTSGSPRTEMLAVGRADTR
jgi:hypothetical protein